MNWIILLRQCFVSAALVTTWQTDKDDATQDNASCEIDNVTDHLPPANALKAAIDAVPKNSL